MDWDYLWREGAWPAAKFAAAFAFLGLVSMALDGELIGTEAWAVQLGVAGTFALIWLAAMIVFCIARWREIFRRR